MYVSRTLLEKPLAKIMLGTKDVVRKGNFKSDFPDPVVPQRTQIENASDFGWSFLKRNPNDTFRTDLSDKHVTIESFSL